MVSEGANMAVGALAPSARHNRLVFSPKMFAERLEQPRRGCFPPDKTPHTGCLRQGAPVVGP